ncbi:MAG: hypothetical protein FWC68_00475, partial [Oscillospiraceae bacterium]|nr:hypothetical protein [Oscillospiraceae bacterium]
MNEDENIEEKEEPLRVEPLEEYKTPEYPNQFEARKNPELLNKLPSRWQKNTKVIACIGLVGTMTLAGFLYINRDSNEQGVFPRNTTGNITTQIPRYELLVRAHHGGGGGAPIYVVYLTEQEALGIIRAGLEDAGLLFNSRPPNHTVDVTIFTGRDHFGMGRDTEVGLDLYSREKSVGISYIAGERNSARQVEIEFERQHRNLWVRAFYTPSEVIG